MYKKIIFLLVVCILISGSIYAEELSYDKILTEIEKITNIANEEKRLEAYDNLANKLGFNIIKVENNIENVVKKFMSEQGGYGSFLNSKDMPDWAHGVRKGINTTKGSYLFYFYENENEKMEVTGVWEYLDDSREQIYHKDIPELPSNVEREGNNTIPKYKILDQFKLLSGGKQGDILIPSFSQDDPSNQKQEKIFRKIMKKEGFSQATFYCTEKAFKANLSSSYSENHPDALDEGFLGMFDEEGNYYDNKDLGYKKE